MKTEHLVAASDFCVYHQVEYTFITSLNEAGLIQITSIDEAVYIPESELQKLEKMIRMHNDLELNIPGIEAVAHLLEKVEQLQEDRRWLQNRLRMYETD